MAQKTFQRERGGRQGSTYICGACGKRTRETGYGESQYGYCVSCLKGFEKENEHSDYGHPEFDPNCPTCKAEK